MSDRIHSLTVVLENDVKEDALQWLYIAIRQLRGVLDVQGNVADPVSFMAVARAKSEMRAKILEILD